MSSGRSGSEARLFHRAVVETTPREILVALLHGWCLGAVVPLALAQVERDPLVSVGCFHGDLMRGLMEVPGGFWGRHPRLYDRYRAALRESAAVRRRQPSDARMQFWSPLDPALIDGAEVTARETRPSPLRGG